MFRLLIDFFVNPEAFLGTVAKVVAFANARASLVRGGLVVCALGIISGEGPFAPVKEWLGSAGPWGAAAMVVLTVMVRAGNITPPAADALAHANPQQLAELLKRIGVPEEVAKAAAAGEAIPKPEAK